MGFETQEEAERWAEEMEFRADAEREERLLRGRPYSDEHLIGALRGCALAWGSDQMKAELMAAADRLLELTSKQPH